MMHELLRWYASEGRRSDRFLDLTVKRLFSYQLSGTMVIIYWSHLFSKLRSCGQLLQKWAVNWPAGSYIVSGQGSLEPGTPP